jgi:hypothetical protein
MKKRILKNEFKQGQWFRAEIDGTKCIGRICISESDSIYLCQDVADGADAPNKLGFQYSWCVSNGSAKNLKENDIENLKLLSRRPALYVPPTPLPKIGSYSAVLINNGETIKVGCTPVSKKLYLAIGRKAGWIE